MDFFRSDERRHADRLDERNPSHNKRVGGLALSHSL